MVRLSPHPAFCWNVGVKSTGLTISPSPYSSEKWKPVEASVMLQICPGLHVFFLQYRGIPVEMYTCSNTALGRKRKNRWFCFLIFKPPRCFLITKFFSVQTCAPDHSHRALLSRPLTLLAHLHFLYSFPQEVNLRTCWKNFTEPLYSPVNLVSCHVSPDVSWRQPDVR